MSGKKDIAGFTYISALILVVVAAIALTEAGRYWSTVMQRDREEELLFRGDQIRKAIQSYYTMGKEKSGQYPRRLQDLIKDPRFLATRRHLRKIYKEPLSANGEWGLIRAKGGSIKGVFSQSTKRPKKTGNFPKSYQDFEDATKYSDWKFVYIHQDKTSATKTGG